MRVLWFPGNGASYANTNKYNGGGWTSALACELIRRHPDIQLGMAIPWNKTFKDKRAETVFYGIPPIRHGIIGYDKKLRMQLEVMNHVLEDFRPDVIHVFGSEHTGGMVSAITDIPVVLHLQGIMIFLGGAWLPQNLSWGKFISWHPRKWFQREGIRRACRTEREIFRHCRYYMGRTEMDKRVSAILSPRSTYFYCSEMLRPAIYHSEKVWQPHAGRRKKKIVSIISSPVYKGGDVILRAAGILKNMVGFDFEWQVYGVDGMRDWERLTHIHADDVGVKCCGVITAEELVDCIMEADVCVHPSYIENSPNTVCEAQLLGIPVIANYVGGTPSLIRHGEDGILLPANDVFQTASYVMELCGDTALAERIGSAGRRTALLRHAPKTIVNDVLTVYQTILSR